MTKIQRKILITNNQFSTSQVKQGPQQIEQEDALLSLQVRLLQLLNHQIGRYTCDDSTSIPEETAQALLQSLFFTLNIEQKNLASNALQLYHTDLNQRYQVGIATIKHKLCYGQKLWRTVYLNMPDIENRSLKDTLQSIGTFWKQYDFHFAAHEIPCDIDYQLCHPVSSALQGIDYINRYLEHLLIETKFLQQFEKSKMQQLLHAYCQDYHELLINLFDPVATNAVGLVLLHKDIFSLEITPTEQKKLLTLLLLLSKTETITKLQQTAIKLCQTLHVSHTELEPYIKKIGCRSLSSHEVCLLQRDLSGIFLCF